MKRSICAYLELQLEVDHFIPHLDQTRHFRAAKKSVTAKGEKLYDEMMKKVDKVLQERGEKW